MAFNGVDDENICFEATLSYPIPNFTRETKYRILFKDHSSYVLFKSWSIPKEVKLEYILFPLNELVKIIAIR
jgi:hypothetical protein